jgi:hypothetical protein
MSRRDNAPVRRRTPMGLAIVGLFVLAGCSTAPPSSSGSASSDASAVGAPPIDCAAIDLVTPAGDRLDLTGT